MVKLGILPREEATRACGHLAILYSLLRTAQTARVLGTIIRATPIPGLRSSAWFVVLCLLSAYALRPSSIGHECAAGQGNARAINAPQFEGL
jgi:hypothetical protein